MSDKLILKKIGLGAFIFSLGAVFQTGMQADREFSRQTELVKNNASLYSEKKITNGLGIVKYWGADTDNDNKVDMIYERQIMRPASIRFPYTSSRIIRKNDINFEQIYREATKRVSHSLISEISK